MDNPRNDKSCTDGVEYLLIGIVGLRITLVSQSYEFFCHSENNITKCSHCSRHLIQLAYGIKPLTVL